MYKYNKKNHVKKVLQKNKKFQKKILKNLFQEKSNIDLI